MSHDLLIQLSEYGTYCDERQGTVTADDITDAVMPLPMATQPTRPRQGWLIAVAAAALVLLVAGGLALLAPFGGNEVAPINEPAVTTIPIPTTVPTTTIPPEALVTQTTTSTPPPSTTEATRPPRAFDLLDEVLARDGPVSGFYSADVVPELEYIDWYLNGMAEPAASREPRFDTDALGTELVLVALDASALASLPSYADNDMEPLVEHPFLVGARLAGTGYEVAYRLDIGFGGYEGADPDLVTPNWMLFSTWESSLKDFPDTPIWAFAQNNRFADPDQPNIILATGAHSASGEQCGSAVIGGLPPNASVVTMAFDDGTRFWQRPLSGIAIVVDVSAHCDDPKTARLGHQEYRVLDADGVEILQITTTANGDTIVVEP